MQVGVPGHRQNDTDVLTMNYLPSMAMLLDEEGKLKLQDRPGTLANHYCGLPDVPTAPSTLYTSPSMTASRCTALMLPANPSNDSAIVNSEEAAGHVGA
jgi:hypothetical protein